MLYIFLLVSVCGEMLHFFFLCDMNIAIPKPLEYLTEVLRDYWHLNKYNTFRQSHPDC